MMASNYLACIICIGLCVAAFAETLPFAFGNSTNDIFLGPNDESYTENVSLPQPMAFLDNNVTSVWQFTNGFIQFYTNVSFAGRVSVFLADMDTRNGGEDQNEIWLRVGKRADDLNIARDIIAGNGTFFAPQAVIVATWYKVEAFLQRAGPQNTFQVAMAYSATGETWAIFAYEQLQFYATLSRTIAFVEYRNKTGAVVQNFFRIDSDATMNAVLNGTNCNRTGIYVHRINKGGLTNAPTKAPTKSPTIAPTKAPTKAPTIAPTKMPNMAPTKVPTMAPTPAPTSTKCGLFGWSVFCPLTLCGLLGRWLDFCNAQLSEQQNIPS